MTYALISDDMLVQLEHAQVTRDAMLLHLEAIVYCATAITDGEIRVRLGRISGAEDPESLAVELVAAGFWDKTPYGFYVADFLKHNRKRDEVEQSKEQARERKERSRRHRANDHTMCTRSTFCPQGALEQSPHVTRDRTRDKTRDRTPTYPIQSNPTQGGLERIEIQSAEGSATALARVRPAPAEDEPHIFADRTGTGRCHYCGEAKTSRQAEHQNNVPDCLSLTGHALATAGYVTWALPFGLEEQWWELHVTGPGWLIKVRENDQVLDSIDLYLDFPDLTDDDIPAFGAHARETLTRVRHLWSAYETDEYGDMVGVDDEDDSWWLPLFCYEPDKTVTPRDVVTIIEAIPALLAWRPAVAA